MRRLKADGELVQDSQKPLVFISGRRPYTGGLTAGAVEAMSTMNAGGKRRIFVPAAQVPNSLLSCDHLAASDLAGVVVTVECYLHNSTAYL